MEANLEPVLREFNPLFLMDPANRSDLPMSSPWSNSASKVSHPWSTL